MKHLAEHFKYLSAKWLYVKIQLFHANFFFHVQYYLRGKRVVTPFSFKITFSIQYSLHGPKNFRILTRPPAILHSSYSWTKKDDPLALTKFFLVRTSRRVDSLDSASKLFLYQYFILVFLSSANAFNLDQSKILLFGKGLIHLKKNADLYQLVQSVHQFFFLSLNFLHEKRQFCFMSQSPCQVCSVVSVSDS